MWSLSHPDDLAIPSMSPGWLIVDALCHPDLPGVGISSGWVTANPWCHPDDILFHFMLSGWLNWGWFLIRMSYGNVIMSSEWDTLPFLSHPDEIANFDFPHNAVALQRFHTIDFQLSYVVIFVAVTQPGNPKCSTKRKNPLSFPVTRFVLITVTPKNGMFMQARGNITFLICTFVMHISPT